ncbi:ROK family protein [Saccharibacillus deserti]|uniref:ROK family protein n=1 Tax=Saccharibacillus deserti TaxID=1634444 RepID=UPI0015556E87|nr:ROK family protein [Saccharibacillus deserti]
MSSLIVAFDVGGTQIKAAAVIDGEVSEATVGYYASTADLDAEPLIAYFADVFGQVLAQTESDSAVDGFGLAFPGPFDYTEGVSRIRGLGKFDSLYGLPFGRLLEQALRREPAISRRLAPHFRIAFENDALLFGLGESASGGAAAEARRALCLTIGTGLGSCFLEEGKPVKRREDVPDEGWLYRLPYGAGIADDCISRRGVLELAGRQGLAAAELDVRDLAMLADEEDMGARSVFEQFGQRMAQILLPSLLSFRPDTIVLGGQISKSAHLFVPAFQTGLLSNCPEIDIRVSRSTLFSTLLGIHDFVISRHE